MAIQHGPLDGFLDELDVDDPTGRPALAASALPSGELSVLLAVAGDQVEAGRILAVIDEGS